MMAKCARTAFGLTTAVPPPLPPPPPPDCVAARRLCLCLQGADPTARINSISFHRTEDLLVSASDDDTIKLYNTQTGTESK